MWNHRQVVSLLAWAYWVTHHGLDSAEGLVRLSFFLFFFFFFLSTWWGILGRRMIFRKRRQTNSRLQNCKIVQTQRQQNHPRSHDTLKRKHIAPFSKHWNIAIVEITPVLYFSALGEATRHWIHHSWTCSGSGVIIIGGICTRVELRQTYRARF